MARAAKSGGEEKTGLEEGPHYHGHRERLRARFREAGADAVADYELVELVLFRAIPQRDVKPLAKALIETFGSFAETISAPETRLREIKGLARPPLPRSRSCRRRPAGWQGARLGRARCWLPGRSVLDYCRTEMAFAEQEQFRILFLDKRNQLIVDEVQQTGTVDHTPVYPREVVKRALELSATARHPRPHSSVGGPDSLREPISR